MTRSEKFLSHIVAWAVIGAIFAFFFPWFNLGIYSAAYWLTWALNPDNHRDN